MIIYSIAKTATDLDDIYQLRFRVGCLERGLQQDFNPTGRERDEYDADAIHAVARHFDLMAVGTARLVPRTALGLPLEKTWSLGDASHTQSAELSKLAISRLALSVTGARNMDVLMGLLRVLCRESRLRGTQQWYLQLTEGMRRLLSRQGVQLTQVGIGRSRHDVSLYVVQVGHLDEILSPFTRAPLRSDLRRCKRPVHWIRQALTC
jgi:N-acyl-L-homoserine lactone synthetase